MNDRQQLIEYQDACRNCAGEQNTQYVVARWSRAYIVFDKCETLPLFGKKTLVSHSCKGSVLAGKSRNNAGILTPLAGMNN